MTAPCACATAGRATVTTASAQRKSLVERNSFVMLTSGGLRGRAFLSCLLCTQLFRIAADAVAADEGEMAWGRPPVSDGGIFSCKAALQLRKKRDVRDAVTRISGAHQIG